MSANDFNYYQILEVNQNATEKEIEKSYQELVAKWNPEKFREVSKCEDGACGLEKAGQRKKHFCSSHCREIYEEHKKKFKEINDAYETLSDSQKKKVYDLQESNKNNNYISSNHPKGNDGFSLKTIGWGIVVVIFIVCGLLVW